MNDRPISPGDLIVHGGTKQWLRHHLHETIEYQPELTDRPFVLVGDTMIVLAVVQQNWLYVLINNRTKFGWIHKAGQIRV